MAKNRFTAPVGRFVQGSADEPQTKDAQGNLRVVKTGPNAGQPNPQYFMAVAYPKADPRGEFADFWRILVAQAGQDFAALFPHGVQAIADAGGPQPWFNQPPAGHAQAWIMHPQFSFKVIDGDGLDQNGKPNSTKEGFAGHWVVRFGSAYPPRCFHAGRYAPNEQIQEKGAIKRGYFVRISGTVEGNGNAQRPGLYVNLDLVELSAYGPEIVSGPDASAAFGGGPAALPAGASATPLTPPAPAPGAPAAPPVAPPAAGAPAVPPTQPYAGYMTPPPGAPVAGAPAPPAAPSSAPPAIPSPTSAAPPPPPSAPTGPVMLPPAQGATYEQMIAAGWTPDTLRQHGMMA